MATHKDAALKALVVVVADDLLLLVLVALVVFIILDESYLKAKPYFLFFVLLSIYLY